MYIYDGAGRSSPLIGRFWGNTAPAGNILSTGNQVLVNFISDEAISGKGWELAWDYIRPEYCSDTIFHTATEGMISDGSNEKNYVENADCYYVIDLQGSEYIRISFTEFDLENDYDFVKIFDLNQPNVYLYKFSGHDIPAEVIIPLDKLLVHFHSDSRDNYSGWTLFYSNYGPGVNEPVSSFRMGPNPVRELNRITLPIRSDIISLILKMSLFLNTPASLSISPTKGLNGWTLTAFQAASTHSACNTLLESALCYNGEAADGQGISGEYGEHPPAQSFTCLNYTMDGFVYFLNWGVPSPMQDPANAQEYYNYLRGFWRDSTRFTYGGNGYGGTIPVKQIFTGDPLTGTGWTEFDSPQGPGDRRGLITSGPYDLAAGDTIHLEFAFVFARDHEGNNLSSFALLKDRIQQVRDFYENAMNIPESMIEQPAIWLYPNPCYSKLYCSLSHDFGKTPGDYFIYDITGKKVVSGRLMQEENHSIYTGDLSPGYYLIQIKGNQASGVARFIRGTD